MLATGVVPREYWRLRNRETLFYWSPRKDNFMKKSLKVLLVVCVIFGLCSCGGKQDNSVLTMATEATFEPFEFYDGDEIIGIDVEIAAAIAEKLGMTLEVTDIAFDSIVPSVQAGKYDIGMAGMTVTDERLEQVNFTDSYAQGVQVVIVNEDSPITSIDDLFAEGANNLVGTQSGTTGFLYATWDIADAGLGEVKDYAKTTDAATALLNKQIDCILLDSEPAKAIVANNAGLKILDSEYSIEDYAIAISKDNTELTEKVNGALNELIADGTVKNILDKYIGD